jgi:hypothetical protein
MRAETNTVHLAERGGILIEGAATLSLSASGILIELS